ncbi:MAG: AmmeMemoRadiSam system protein B [Gammaproteobacteria bacterium]|nr:MAG: AmmeMemoRadiSam system protein B [Gammaproteobacteria bacterium]
MPNVAGMFYPAEPALLQQEVDQMLQQARPAVATPPKALIAPHAGYVYSGPVAATAYAALRPVADRIERVVVLAPSHRVAFRGIAAPTAEAFQTPLGTIPVDREAVQAATRLPQVGYLDEAFEGEHALEVQLPFLQRTLGSFELAPFIVGEASPEEVAQLLDLLWGGDETLIVVSSDLSHYHDYDTAVRRDRATTAHIESLDPHIDYGDACGRNPIRGLLLAAREHGLTAETVDLRNSGDTAGPKDRVVGYGAYVFH